MPRDGALNWHRPVGTDAVTDTSIESSKYNAFLGDLEGEMNNQLPITRGGTGAANAAAAMTALGGELAKQLITDYNTQTFQAGSFYSDSTPGRNAPVDGHAFHGICYVTDANNLTIEARDLTEATAGIAGSMWVRTRKAGVWSAWVIDPTKAYVDSQIATKAAVYTSLTPPVGAPDNSLWWKTDTGQLFVRYNDGDSAQWVIATPAPDLSLFLLKAGDTMTGPLTVTPKGSRFGGAAGTAINTPYAPVVADANILLYNNSAANWSGIGVDANGNFWLRAGISGTPFAAFYVEGANQNATFLNPPSHPTPAAGDNSTKSATTAFVNANAAPFDAMAYSGMQVNGQMDVSQERGTSGQSTVGQYICDHWIIAYSGTMLLTGVGGANMYVAGIGGLLSVTTPTAQVTLGAGDNAHVLTRVEGYRMARLQWGGGNAQPVTIGFWSAHARTGVYTGTARNSAANRSYAFTYTHNVANVPQFNVITIPGCPDGTWLVDSGLGLQIAFAMGCGTTFTAPSANTWLTGNYVAGPGQVNAVGATSDVFRITGVIILPGTQAPSAARLPFIMRPYDQELLLCRRYWESSYAVGTPPGTATSVGNRWLVMWGVAATASGFNLHFAPKRVQPTVTIYSPGTGVAGNGWNFYNSTDVSGSISTSGDSSAAVSFSHAAQNVQIACHFKADARI